jgi:hypothetical protein
MNLLEGDPAGGLLTDDPDKMEDRLTARHAVLETLADEDVAFHSLDGAQAAQVALGPPAHEAANTVTIGAKGLNHGPPDEPGRAGDEDAIHTAPPTLAQACQGREASG